MHWPRRGQLLATIEDFLHDHVGTSGGVAQPLEIVLRVRQTIDVVDPQAVDRAAGDQLEDQPMGVDEDPFVLHAQAHQRLDIEEPTVGQLLGSGPPVRQAVVLSLQEGVEGVQVLVGRLDLGGHGGRHLGFAVVEVGQGAQQLFFVAVTLLDGLRLSLQGVWESPESGPHRGQSFGTGSRRSPADQFVQRPGRQRRLVLVVAHRERPLAVPDPQFSRFQDAAVVVAENGHQHVGRQLPLGGIPVDVEIGGVAARWSVFEDVPPPRVRPAVDGHVIGHDVEQLAHTGLLQPAQ